jgi:hypothetical protein
LALLAGGIAMTVPGYPMLLQGSKCTTWTISATPPAVPWARAQSTHAGIVRANADLIRLRRNLKGITPGLKGTELDMLHCDNDAKVIAYARLQQAGAPRDRATVVVANFSGAPLKQYGVRFPASGAWYCHYNSGLAAYAKDFDNVGAKPGSRLRPAARPNHAAAGPQPLFDAGLFQNGAAQRRLADQSGPRQGNSQRFRRRTDAPAGQDHRGLRRGSPGPLPLHPVPLPAEWKP